jgi:serine/threonine protein kinase
MRSGLISRDRVIEYVTEGVRAFSPGDIAAGRYKITRFIAEGGMGEVYEADDRELGGLIALKTIRPALARKPRLMAAFKREIHLAHQVTHPNVCRVFDLFWHVNEDGAAVAFLTMELLAGETLAEYLQVNGPFSPKRAIPLVRQIVAGLASAHELGITHRDLKPRNIMLLSVGSSEERAVITDFGLAISPALHPEATDRSGTPAYMAPEQSAGGSVGPRADVFALGLIISEILTGARPHLDRNSKDKSLEQVQKWLSARRELNSTLRPVIRKCLQFLPEDRFADAGEVGKIIEAAASRTRLQELIAGAAVLLATLVVAFVFLRDQRDAIVDSARLTPESVMSAAPSLSRDRDMIAYTSNRADPQNLDIWVQSIRAQAAKRLTTDPAADTDPSISSDGRLVAFRSERNAGGIYVVGTEGSPERLLVAAGRNPAFSPDGKSIAYWVGAQDLRIPARSYSYSLETGVQRQLAPSFADVRYPSWSTESDLLVFYGRAAQADDPDWWIIPPPERAPIASGALRLLNAESIEPDVPPKCTISHNRLVFAGKQDRIYKLWYFSLSPSTLHVRGRPRLLALSDTDEMAPAITSAGVIAREHVSGVLHVWAIPYDRMTPGRREERLTDGLEPEICPAISADERSLFFTREGGGQWQLLVENVESRQESLLYSSHEVMLWPTPDTERKRVAFESQNQYGPSVVLLEGGRTRTLCAGCSHPSEWLFDRSHLLLTDAGGSPAVLNVDNATWETVLPRPSDTVIADTVWNATSEFMLFAAASGGSKQVFAAHVPKKTKRAETQWIALTTPKEGGDRPRWSPDGTRFFYLSNQDGFYCIWTRTFDASRRAVGPAEALKHYHDRAFGPAVATPFKLSLSVGSHSVYLNVGDVSSTIWVGRIHWNPFVHPVYQSFDRLSAIFWH